MKGKRASACGSTLFYRMDIKLLEHERIDDLQFGGLRIIQSEKAFRFGMDAVLLADFAQPKSREAVVDLGCNGGIITLLLHGREPSCQYLGIDIDAQALDRAQRTLALNNISCEDIRYIHGDIRNINALCHANSATLIVCNPPYHVAPGGNTLHENARMEASCTLQDVAYAARFLLKNRGRLCMIYPTARLQELCITLEKNGLSVKRLRFIQHRSDLKPKLMLVESYMGAKGGEVQVLPPLIIEENGQESPEIRRIYHMNNA